jgi:hypothetical protein
MHPEERKIITRMRNVLLPFIAGGILWFVSAWMSENQPDPFLRNETLYNILRYLGLALCGGSFIAFVILRWQYRRYLKRNGQPPRSDHESHQP